MSLVLYHTDIHGGMSGLVAIKSLEKLGEKIQYHYSNFSKEPPGTEPDSILDTLKILVGEYNPSKTYLLDIALPKYQVLKASTILTELSKTTKIELIDHHELPESADKLIPSEILKIFESSYEMTMYLPRKLRTVTPEIEKFALIGAVSDADHTVADKTPKTLEYQVNMYLDYAWKATFKKNEEIAKHIPRHGSAGAIVQYILEKNLGPEDLLKMAEANEGKLKLLKHKIIGNVVVATEIPPEGLGRKSAWLLMFETDVPVAIVKHTPKNTLQVIVAGYWRNPKIKEIVESAVLNTIQDRAKVIGHPGARSILVSTEEEADKIIKAITTKINEKLSQTEKAAISI